MENGLTYETAHIYQYLWVFLQDTQRHCLD